MKKLLLIAFITLGSLSSKAQDTQLYCHNTRITYQYNGNDWVITSTVDDYDCKTIPLAPGKLEEIEYMDNGWVSKAYVFTYEGDRYSVVYYFRGEHIVYYRILKEGSYKGYGFYFDKNKS